MNNHICFLNGPNLNLLGVREPDVYGHDTLADIEQACKRVATDAGLSCGFQQSNHEGDLVDFIQAARESSVAIIINPGAYSHTSVAILDALQSFDGPVIEVHVSNIHRRESFRHHSYVSRRADGVIAGCGVQGYLLALQRVSAMLKGNSGLN